MIDWSEFNTISKDFLLRTEKLYKLKVIKVSRDIVHFFSLQYIKSGDIYFFPFNRKETPTVQEN